MIFKRVEKQKSLVKDYIIKRRLLALLEKAGAAAISCTALITMCIL